MVERQCWGRTRSLRRCGRLHAGLFCYDHRAQPILALFTIALGVLSFASDLIGVKGYLRPSGCHARAVATNDIVTRAYTRQWFDALAAQQTFSFDFQEMFYEWKVVVDATGIDGLSVTATHVQVDDRFKATPAYHHMGSAVAGWMSGFEEKGRSPDHFHRTVVFPRIGSEPATIIVRRLIDGFPPSLAPHDLIEVVEIASGPCRVEIAEADASKEADRLNDRIRKIIEGFRPSGRELPLRRDPGDLDPNAMQGTIEVRCADDTCSRHQAGQMEVRLGSTIGEIVREQRYNACVEQAQVLAGILGCVDGPYCVASLSDPPAATCEFAMCGESFVPTPQIAIQLRDFFGGEFP